MALVMVASPWPAAGAQERQEPPIRDRQDRGSAAVVQGEGRRDGEALAGLQGGWLDRSALIGFFTGVVGTGITVAVASSSTPRLPATEQIRISEKPTAYQMGFVEGYEEAMRRKRVRTSVKGGLLGSAAAGLVLFGLAH